MFNKPEGENMDDEYGNIKELLEELDVSATILFDNLYCQECSLPLKDYGYDFYLCGESDFIDLILCGKCAADYCGEEDYHSEKLKDILEINVVESNETENLSNIFPLLA
jgi:hypothetical protein